MLLYVTLALIGLCLLCIPLNVTSEYQICINKSVPVMTDEQRLYTVLMKDYDRNTRPVFNASHIVTVSVGITLTQIFDVDERNQVITTNIWLDQNWEDEKLTWDPADYNGLSVLRIPCKSLWLPDIVLYNSAEDYTQGFMEALAMVNSTGTVFWPPIVKLRSTCAIDITYFPFDDQLCHMKVGSWAYDGFQVDVVNTSNGIDLSNFVSNGEWELKNVKAVRNVVKYPCCPEPFPDVTFTLHISRRTLYYTYNVIIPCVMLSVLTLLGFWMRPDSGEKVTLGLTVLLAFSVFMLLIAENMPATSSFVPLIGIYLTTVMALTSMSVILAVVTSNINQRGFKDSDLPSFFRNFIIFLARIMCMKLAHVHYDNQDELRLEQIRNGMRDGYAHHMKTTFSNDSGCNLIEYENGESRTPNNANIRLHPGDRNWELQEILNRLQILIQKEEEKEKSDNLAKRWMEASEVIDRFLFWIFVIGTVFSSIFLLLVYPTVKTVSVDS